MVLQPYYLNGPCMSGQQWYFTFVVRIISVSFLAMSVRGDRQSPHRVGYGKNEACHRIEVQRYLLFVGIPTRAAVCLTLKSALKTNCMRSPMKKQFYSLQ